MSLTTVSELVQFGSHCVETTQASAQACGCSFKLPLSHFQPLVCFLQRTFTLSLFTRILLFVFTHAVLFVFYGRLLQLRLLIPNRSMILLSCKLMPNLVIHVFKILLNLLELLSSLISYAALALLHCLEG